MKFVESLADQVEIVPQSTVSKVVANEGPLRLVVFAFDTGEELTEHTASVPVVLQILTGTATIEASGDTVELRAGGWLFLEANEPHSVVAVEPAKMLLTMVRNS